jgi:undecaprenyl diphosphate synthase
MVRETVRSCLERGVEYLTLFAFSSENWRRPQEEVSLLMQLFVKALEQEVVKLDRNGVRLRIIGDLSHFEGRLQELIRTAEARTAVNSRLHLTIAANYGGRWDIMQAVNAMLVAQPDKRAAWDEAELEPFLSMAFAPEPDLFIRTGGEERISNFLLWQLAYTELYFTGTLWPEFDRAEFDLAITSYQQRERRFGRTSEQLVGDANA